MTDLAPEIVKVAWGVKRPFKAPKERRTTLDDLVRIAGDLCPGRIRYVKEHNSGAILLRLNDNCITNQSPAMGAADNEIMLASVIGQFMYFLTSIEHCRPYSKDSNLLMFTAHLASRKMYYAAISIEYFKERILKEIEWVDEVTDKTKIAEYFCAKLKQARRKEIQEKKKEIMNEAADAKI